MGDVLFTLPAVSVIRHHFPHSRITFLTSNENAPLLEGFSDVDEAVGIDRSVYHRGNPWGIVTETISLLRWLREKKFSLVVDFQGYGETGLITRLSRAKERWGAVYRASRAWAYTRPVTREALAHPVEWNLSLLRQCGLSSGEIRNEFVVPDTALAEAHCIFSSHKMDPAVPSLFIQPFTSSAKKNWSLENFLSLANHWKSRGVQILFGGGPADRLALEPARLAGFPVSAGAPLLVSAGLMKLSTVVIGGDTGLIHLAVAMGKRVVMLSPSSAHCRCHPFQHADWTLKPHAGKSIAAITPGMAIEACAKVFGEVRPGMASAGRPSHHFLTGARPAMALSTDALPAP